ncbi:MAG: Fic family protein [Bacilli bacterium]|nr:Fic family protein [Bacilli bacterium]
MMTQTILTKPYNYFSLEEYIKNINLNDITLSRSEEINNQFDDYINTLKKYDAKAIFYFLVSSFEHEVIDSNLMEKHLISPLEINKHNILYDTFKISHKRIKDIHDFATKHEVNYDYRDNEVRVSSINPHTKHETIFWYGAKPEDIKAFIDDFIEIYRKTSPSAIHSNPFIKSALIHLLMVRIHPFYDGNGRTARLLHSMKFTEMINKIYNYNLKVAPLHISPSLYRYQHNYVHAIDQIHFGLDKNIDEEINHWFQFILNRYEDQLFYMSNLLKTQERTLDNIANLPCENDDLETIALRRFKKTTP